MSHSSRLVLLVGLAMAGCTDTRDLAPASPDTPWQISTQHSPAVEAPAPTFALPRDPALPWPDKEARLDPAHRFSLPELIDIAQQRNKETRIAWEQARQAAIGVGIARAAFLPEITASVLAGYQRVASPFPTNLVRQGYITANAQEVLPELAIKYLLIDFGGGREAAEQGARHLSFAANVEFTAAHQKLILSVAQAYFALDAVDAQLEAARRALADAHSLRQAAEALRGRGLATVVDTQVAERGMAQATFDVAQATATQHQASYALLQVLELPPNTRLLVENSFDRPIARETLRTVDQMMQDALRQRADLLAGLARLRAADAGIAEARANMAPKLLIDANVQGNVGRISVDGGPYQSVAQPQAGLFLRFEWPLFQGGLRENQLRQAQSRRAAAEDALEASSTAAMREVALAYDQVQTGLRQHDAAAALQRAAQSAYVSALDAYRHGTGSFTDAVNATTALAAARATVVKAHAQALINAAGLAFAAGELTSSTAPAIGGSIDQERTAPDPRAVRPRQP
jgi:outer membrane protein